ncbi:histone-fold-containing protein [Lophium mytilinum]|uniref:DNA polymerase epsilon subunit D n=1 Tax=Lophium mytilinum TaxID=390894 RepID=A0A6A6QV24_9PEZI|nr:histone-fold-containing protein [Lophium mytilinum]
MVSNPEDAGPPPPPKDGLSVEDLSLPRTMVQRLAKGVLPPNTQIQKDALLAMSKGATVFVNYLTNTSWENTMRGGKKTINPKDVLDAVKELEFEAFLPRLEAELQKYNAIQCDKRNTYRKKIRDANKAAKASNPDGVDQTEEPSIISTNGNGHRADDDSPPAAKKARRSSLGATGSEGDDTDGNMGEQAEEDQQDEEHEDDDVEDDEEGEENGGETQLTEDPLEIRDDDMGNEGSDSDESD